MKYLLFVTVCLPLSAAAEQSRSLDAHEHGAGTLGIAISASEVAMSLEAPGMDIVGFEHSATSAEDRAAVETAVSDLARPMDLFVLPESAGCLVKGAKVFLEGDDPEHAHDDEHADEDDHAHDDDHAEEQTDEHGAEHTEFRAEYILQCENPQNIDRIEFAYFERFPNAREMDVQIVTDSGATGHEVERDTPVLELKGLF